MDAVARNQPLRVVMLTSPEYVCRYVANRIADRYPWAGLVIEGGRMPETTSAAAVQLCRVWRGVRRRVWPSPGERAEQARNRAREALYDRLMGREWREFCFKRIAQVVRVPCPGINLPAVERLMDAVRPDAAVVFGTTIIRPGLLARIPGVCLNIHTGLVPYYRGTHSTQWALLNGDLAGIGVTVYHVQAELDAGPIVLQGRPQLEPQDTKESIEVKLALLAGELMLRALDHLARAGTLPGVPQDLTVGRCYRRCEFDPAARTELDRVASPGELRRRIEELPRHWASAPAIVDTIAG